MDPIEQIKAIDLRDLLPSGIELRNNVACCPFGDHQEKTGSFRYYPDTNSFMCWGCRRGGSTIDLWMHLQGLDAKAAIKDLADRHHITLEARTPEQEARHDAARRQEEARAYAADFYARALEKAEPVMVYLAERGITAETARALRLGFANKQLTAAVKGDTGVAARGIDIADFDAAGLTRPETVEDGKTRKAHDYFRERITFPVVVRGRVVQMAGRAMPESLGGHAGAPKYLNLPGALDCLYLEENIKERTYIFEGLPDTVTMHQWGVPAVGQLGTGGAEKQAAKFKRCRRVWICFDNDAAGRASADRTAKAIHRALDAGEVRILFPPEGHKDWNDWAVKTGGTADEFHVLAKAAPALPDFLIDAYPAEADHAERHDHLKSIVALMTTMNATARDHYMKRLRDVTGLKAKAIEEMIDEAIGGGKKAGQAAAEDHGAVILTETVTEIIPAQDFAFNSPARGNMATFLPVQRTQVDKEGNSRKIKKVEPVLIFVVHEAGKPVAIRMRPARDLPLSDAEKRRVPNETGVRGRWRPDAKFPFGIERFVKGAVAEVDDVQLFNDILAVFRAHVVFPSPADAEVLVLFAMATYVYQLFEAFPYIHLHGIRESGKSDVGRILEELCFNAFMAASQTQSTVVRSAEMNCRVQIVDEAERLNNPKPDTADHEVMLIANSGYKRGAKAEKSEWDDIMKRHVPTPFDIYSPKVFASIASLNYVLASRCIIIPCLRATPEELEAAQVVSLSQAMHVQAANLADIRDRLYCWALLRFPELRRVYVEEMIANPSLGHLRGRERELWLPLLTVAFHLDRARCGGDMDEMARQADDGLLLAQRMIEQQRNKERARRQFEAESSIEVATLRAAFDVITSGALGPESSSLTQQLYLIKDLATLVTEQLHEIGALRPDRVMGGKALSEMLRRTSAVSDDAFVRPRIDGEKKRCVSLSQARLKDSIARLGGSVADIEGA